MHPYPHTYSAAATADPTGSVPLSSGTLPVIATAPPPEFDGPGGVWSPETLLCASLADCFILTFRVLARLGRFNWQHLECHVEGTLERIERRLLFTRFRTVAKLIVPPGTDEALGRKLLEQAEHGCLIANSVSGTRTLEAEVVTAPN